jgi:hypothetical protein
MAASRTCDLPLDDTYASGLATCAAIGSNSHKNCGIVPLGAVDSAIICGNIVHVPQADNEPCDPMGTK